MRTLQCGSICTKDLRKIRLPLKHLHLSHSLSVKSCDESSTIMHTHVILRLSIAPLIAETAFSFDTFLGPVFEASKRSTDLTLDVRAHINEALLHECQNAGDSSLLAAVQVATTFNEDPVFNFSFTTRPEKQPVNVDTIFRIGSVSKLFTTYALLILGGIGIFETPVIELLQELRFSKNEKDSEISAAPAQPVNWSEINV